MKIKDKKISIKEDSCIKCGKCARVCPARIMTQEKVGMSISLKYVASCIACGHCVDVCPTDSVVHRAFPPESSHTIDYSMLPTPEQVMLLIKSRRSNRSITSKPIPKETLEQIVEAARYAPTASNKQQVSFTVVTDPETLRSIADFTIEVFDSGAKKLMNPLVKCLLKPFLKEAYKYLPILLRYKKLHEDGEDPILRKATALIVFHTPESNKYGCEDANLAYQNASLMAQSLGISQIYMGFVIMAIKQKPRNLFSQILGINGKIHAIMALGIPAFQYSKYVERN